MKKDITIFLEHILDSIDKIEEFTKDTTEEQFYNSVQLQDSVIRRIEIIGEASKNIPDDFKKIHENIPWSEMAKTRDKLIHGYFGVDLNLTWGIVQNDLPDLKTKIRIILDNMVK